MKDIEDKLDDAYNSFRETWDLDDMTPSNIYKAGFRHGAEEAEREGSTTAIAAINYAITHDEGIEFLRAWVIGDFDAIRVEWPDCPEDAFPITDKSPDYELAELTSFNRTESTQLKEFISSSTDSYRPHFSQCECRITDLDGICVKCGKMVA